RRLAAQSLPQDLHELLVHLYAQLHGCLLWHMQLLSCCRGYSLSCYLSSAPTSPSVSTRTQEERRRGGEGVTENGEGGSSSVAQGRAPGTVLTAPMAAQSSSTWPRSRNCSGSCTQRTLAAVPSPKTALLSAQSCCWAWGKSRMCVSCTSGRRS